MRKFVVGDMHGAAKALKQCLERCGFDYDNDLLITLGDIVDGWSGVFDCVQEILKIRHTLNIRGNHDEWFLDYINTGIHPCLWQMGGWGTATSYLRNICKEDMIHKTGAGFTTALNPGDIPESHKDFFRHQINCFIEDGICFVHGGFDREYLIEDQHPSMLMWDRSLWDQAKSCSDEQKLNTADGFKEIFIGHTHVDGWRNPMAVPITSGGVTNLDTGAGWSGKLTIMDVNTKEYWQSDNVKDLYSDELGRRH